MARIFSTLILMLRILASMSAPRTPRGRGRPARIASIGLGSLVASVSGAGAITLGDFYGRWSIEKDCPFYEIFLPGEEIYFGPERRTPLIRKATFSLNGTTLTHRSVGNRGERDSIRKYQVISSNTLKVISNEDVPGTTGTRSSPGLVGLVFSRCR